MSLNRQLAVVAALLFLAAAGALWIRVLERDAKRDYMRQAFEAQSCGSDLWQCEREVGRR